MLTAPTKRFLALGAGLALALASVSGVAAGASGATAANPVAAAASREVMMPPRGAASHGNPHGASNNLSFHGGNPGVVTGSDLVYLVYWGSGWGTNGSIDPSGEAAIQQSFFAHVGGSSWNASVTQYCDGVAAGTIACGTSGRHAANPAGTLVGGTWYDTTNAAPTNPSQGDLAGEAARAAAHFGRTTAASNQVVQYVISTATGHNASGFGSSYCAWHSWTSSAYGTLAYTNMPYITDAGYACGAGAGGLGPNAGITIVGGHEFAETESDIYPSSGWIDRNGGENGDKCAWINSGQGAMANVSMNGASFPVQSLWSNAFNGGKGDCVQSYP